MITIFNNQIVEDLKIPITSTAFQYGYGVFETLLFRDSYQDKEEHLKRLLESAKTIGLEVSEDIPAMLEKLATKLSKDSRIKIMAIEEGIIITAEDFNPDPAIQNGVSIKSTQQKRAFPGQKTLSYLDSFLPHKIAEQEGYFDALLVDGKGMVSECAYANIFWFEGETLCTTKQNILPGITREKIIRNSPFQIEEKEISLKDLISNEEIFLTQSTNGIVPVTRVNDQQIGDGKPGKNTITLRSI